MFRFIQELSAEPNTNNKAGTEEPNNKAVDSVMEKNKNGNAENPKGIYIYDRRHSKWASHPQSDRLPYLNGGEKSSDSHRYEMRKRSFLQQPQTFVSYGEPEGGIEASSILSMHDSHTNGRSTCRQFYSDHIDSQGLEVACNHRNRRRAPLIKQRQEPFDGNENGCQIYPYVLSLSLQIRNHCKEYSRQHSSGQIGSNNPNLSTVTVQSCTTTLSFITPQNTTRVKFNSTESYRYSYQQKRLDTSNERSGDDSSKRYDRVWNPKRLYRNLMSPNWSSRNFPDRSDLCSTEIWPTRYHRNQHGRPKARQATRSLNVARRTEHLQFGKESDLVAYGVSKAESSGKEQISTIASQFQMS